MTKPHKTPQSGGDPKKLNPKQSRALIQKRVPVEIDLQNREIVFKDDSLVSLNFQPGSTNIDSFIKNYIHPRDTKQVGISLGKAEKGIEEPIRFNFVNPKNARVHAYEYHYQIVYVRYAHTRLEGELVKVDLKRRPFQEKRK